MLTAIPSAQAGVDGWYNLVANTNDRMHGELVKPFARLEETALVLRSVDGAVMRHYPLATGFETHNFVRLPLDQLPENLPALIAESLRLSRLKSFGDLSPILRGALEEVPASRYPEMPFHAGGPSPATSGRAGVEIALWAAESVEATVDAKKRAEFVETCELVRMALRNNATSPDLETVARRGAAPPALRAARRAAGAAASLVKGKPDMVFMGASRAVAYAALAVDDKRQTRWIAELDQQLLRHEFRAQSESRIEQPLPPTFDVLWRGETPAGHPSGWLVRLGSDDYGLLINLKSRYRWAHGTREDVLAVVPDESFERACRVVMTVERALA
jgi:hypothetical protein